MADEKRAEDDRKRTAEDDRKHAAEAEQKRIAQAEEDRKQREQAEQQRRKQARDAPLVPNAEGNVMVECIMGPYRGQRLTMTAADGQAAINDHWARNPTEAEYQHEELAEADRVAAWEASKAWAQAQWDAAAAIGEEPDPPPVIEEGGEGGAAARRRAMQAEQGGGYATRQTPAAPEPKRR